MRPTQINHFLHHLSLWAQRSCTIADLEIAGAFTPGHFLKTLITTGCSDLSGNPTPGLTPQDIINIVLMYYYGKALYLATLITHPTPTEEPTD